MREETAVVGVEAENYVVMLLLRERPVTAKLKLGRRRSSIPLLLLLLLLLHAGLLLLLVLSTASRLLLVRLHEEHGTLLRTAAVETGWNSGDAAAPAERRSARWTGTEKRSFLSSQHGRAMK